MSEWDSFDISENKEVRKLLAELSLSEDSMTNPPSAWEIWIEEGGDGTKESFLTHLSRIGADSNFPTYYGMPQSLLYAEFIDLPRARQLINELKIILGA